MASVEHIARQRIIECGEDVMNAWIKGEKHSPVPARPLATGYRPEDHRQGVSSVSPRSSRRSNRKCRRHAKCLNSTRKTKQTPKMPTVREKAKEAPKQK